MIGRAIALASTMLMAAATPNVAAAYILEFTGTALPGSQGSVEYTSDWSTYSTSFVGDTVNLFFDIENSPYGPYAANFSARWSDQVYSQPFATNYAAGTYPNDISYYLGVIGLESAATIGMNGGTISVFPTLGFLAQTDGTVNLDLNYTLSKPETPGTSFTDDGIMGSGTLCDCWIEGPVNIDSQVSFDLTSVTEFGVPEPATWAMLLVGFGVIGAVRRGRLHGGLRQTV